MARWVAAGTGSRALVAKVLSMGDQDPRAQWRNLSHAGVDSIVIGVG